MQSNSFPQKAWQNNQEFLHISIPKILVFKILIWPSLFENCVYIKYMDMHLKTLKFDSLHVLLKAQNPSTMNDTSKICPSKHTKILHIVF